MSDERKGPFRFVGGGRQLDTYETRMVRAKLKWEAGVRSFDAMEVIDYHNGVSVERDYEAYTKPSSIRTFARDVRREFYKTQERYANSRDVSENVSTGVTGY